MCICGVDACTPEGAFPDGAEDPFPPADRIGFRPAAFKSVTSRWCAVLDILSWNSLFTAAWSEEKFCAFSAACAAF